MNTDKLLAIRHMLLTDEHTRKHWAFWTVMQEMDPYMRQQFEDRRIEPPCGAVGCAIGHAHRMGITAKHHFVEVRYELGMNKDDFDFIFENIGIGRDRDTPKDVVARIDEVLAEYTAAVTDRELVTVE
jgi:hypothetical protein